MSQTAHLVKTLKQCLRAKGIHYRDLAASLGLSESSVKRLFAQRTFSLQRLEEICRVLDMSIYDLARIAAAEDDSKPKELSPEQEAALAGHPHLLATFYLLLIGWKPYRIRHRLGVSEEKHRAHLKELSQLGLVELSGKSRVRLLTDIQVSWRPKGPIRRRFEAQVKEEFCDYPFTAADELFRLESAELSDASIKVLMRRLTRFGEEFAELAEIDRNLPHDQKRGFGFMVAGRPWTFWSLLDKTLAK